MRLIVCGASGYIGARLMHRAGAACPVVGTSSRDVAGAWQLDLARPGRFDAGRIDRTDVFVLAAAISSPDVCERETDRAWALNVTGTTQVIEQVLGRGARVLFLSSDTVYGEQPEAFDERMPCNPAGPYAAMKREVERRFAGDGRFCTLRLSYVFSAQDRFTRYLRDCATRGLPAEVFDPFVRAVVHREDVVDAVLTLAHSQPEPFERVLNVGGPQALSRAAYAATLRDLAWPALRFEIVAPQPQFFRNRPQHIAMQSPRLAALLGRPPLSLAAAAASEPLQSEATEP